MNLDEPVTHEAFGRLVGITHKAVEKHIAKGTLREGATLGEWLRAYCERLRAEAAQRRGNESQALTRARAREAENRARMIELQLARELARLVPAEAIEPDLSSWSSFAWEEAQRMLARVVAAIEAQHGIKIEPGMYQGQLDSARLAIKNTPKFK